MTWHASARYLFFCALIMALTTACTQTAGQKFNRAYINKIVNGTTTKQEVLNNLGAPFQRNITPPNTETWVYMYRTATVTPTVAGLFNVYRTNTSSSSDLLTISFSKEVVSECQFVSSNSPTSEYLSSSGGTNITTRCGK